MEIENDYLVSESCMMSYITYTKNEQKEQHSFKHYIYTLAEIKRLLAAFNLKTIATYSSIDKASFKLGESQLYLVAEKY